MFTFIDDRLVPNCEEYMIQCVIFALLKELTSVHVTTFLGKDKFVCFLHNFIVVPKLFVKYEKAIQPLLKAN